MAARAAVRVTGTAKHSTRPSTALFSSTNALALAFAMQHPQRVVAVVASAIYLASRAENEWVGLGLYRPFYPEIWEQYVARTPKAHQEDPSAYHYKQILGSNQAAVFESALAVEEMEHNLMALDDRAHPIDRETFDPTNARIYAHYVVKDCFLPDNYILKNAKKLTMPVWLVHGRYDMACPPHTAIALHKAVPHSKLYLTIGNHRAEHETWNILRAIFAELGGE
jgi:proline iminopeptidase